MKCTVVRDGKEQELEARDLVPGDIIILEEGETIAADAKVRQQPTCIKPTVHVLGDNADWWWSDHR